jgi:hypothetical protein
MIARIIRGCAMLPPGLRSVKMKKIMVLLLTLLLASVFLMSAKPGSLPAAFIPGDTQWILHLDMQKFASTRLSDLFNEDSDSKLGKVNRHLSTYFRINLLKDIDGITIFGKGKDKNNAVMCWTGNLNKEFLLSLVKDKSEKIPYGKYTIYRVGNDRSYGVFATDHVFLHSRSENTLQDVLDVMDGKRKNITASRMMSYLKGIPTDAFLQAVGNNISSLFKDYDQSSILKKAGMALFIAMEKNENLKLKLKLTTDSPETAQNIHQVVRGFIALARLKQDEQHNKWWRLLETLNVQLKGNVVQMELSYPSGELIEMLSHGKMK